VIGNFLFWPFGYVADSRRELIGQLEIGTRVIGWWIGHISWFLLAGWWQTLASRTSAADCFV
jgi:uncharacterized membrane protein YccF (DUF307 family)